jgi:thiol-disulfide isomerase/thioredoxin
LLTPVSKGVPDPLVGHPAPDFSLALLSAQSGQRMLSLADLTGKPIVLNFWVSWCAPCKEEMPLLEKNWEQAQAQGKDVVFLGVDFQESSSDAMSFLQQHTITYPIGLERLTQPPCQQGWGVPPVFQPAGAGGIPGFC